MQCFKLICTNLCIILLVQRMMEAGTELSGRSDARMYPIKFRAVFTVLKQSNSVHFQHLVQELLQSSHRSSLFKLEPELNI